LISLSKAVETFAKCSKIPYRVYSTVILTEINLLM